MNNSANKTGCTSSDWLFVSRKKIDGILRMESYEQKDLDISPLFYLFFPSFHDKKGMM